MKDIIELNTEIERIIKPIVEYDSSHNNISFFDKWVNEIDYTFFNKWENRIKDKISSIIDIDSPMRVKALKVFHQDILGKYKEQSKIDYNDLEVIKSTLSYYSRNYSLEPPKYDCNIFSYAPDTGFEDILHRMAEFANIDDFDYYDGNHSPDEHKDMLEDEILFKLGFNKNEPKIENREINKLYSYVFLSYSLESTREMLKNIAEFIDSYVNYIKKLENFEEDKFSFEEISDNDPTNLKLEFKINKFGVVFFYRALFESGIIDVDSKNQKFQDTNFIKYLDGANIYFLNAKGESIKVKGIGKEFSKVKKQLKGEYSRQEIELLDLIISKFTDRREKILETV